MVAESVVKEIDKRISRLNALIEIAEERASRGEKPIPKPASPSAFYVWMSIAWLLIGVILLYYIQRRYLGGSGWRFGPAFYAVVGIVILGVIVLYYLSRREVMETFDLDERARAARKVIREFYMPLKEALKKDDFGSIIALADRLLEDPSLGRALELVKEGNPKTVAYALYLYSSARGEVEGQDFDLEEEIARTLEVIDNRAIAALLRILLGEGREQSPEKSGHDIPGNP